MLRGFGLNYVLNAYLVWIMLLTLFGVNDVKSGGRLECVYIYVCVCWCVFVYLCLFFFFLYRWLWRDWKRHYHLLGEHTGGTPDVQMWVCAWVCACVWVSVLLNVSLSVYVFVLCVRVCACVCVRECEAQVLSAMHCARGVVHASTVNKRDMQYYTCTSLSKPPWSSVRWLLLNLCYCPWFVHLCSCDFFHSIHSCVVETCVCVCAQLNLCLCVCICMLFYAVCSCVRCQTVVVCLCVCVCVCVFVGPPWAAKWNQG